MSWFTFAIASTLCFGPLTCLSTASNTPGSTVVYQNLQKCTPSNLILHKSIKFAVEPEARIKHLHISLKRLQVSAQ